MIVELAEQTNSSPHPKIVVFDSLDIKLWKWKVNNILC